MGSLPTRFWVTTGVGVHPEHQINAYDCALYEAGISEQNIMAVSSVPPTTQIFPKIINGLTYVPVPEDYDGQFLTKIFPNEKSKQKYVVLENSWCINVVLARSDADEFGRMTSSVGLGSYKVSNKNGFGIYAVEDHGNKTVDGSIDNCVEMLNRMMEFRHVTPIDDEATIPTKNTTKRTDLLKLSGCGEDKKKYDVERVFYSSREPRQHVYTISMDVPEGYVGTAIAVVVFDPFTELHS